MVYTVTAEKIPGDDRSRKRFLVEASNDREAWDKANTDCKRLGAMSSIVDIRMRPFRISSNASARSIDLARHYEMTGGCAKFSDFHSAVGALFLAIVVIAGFLPLAPGRAQQAGGMSDDVQKGHYLAVLMCSNCDVISPDQSIEPTLQPPAPSFESIAQRSSTSSEALGAFLGTTHRTIGNSAGMPNPELLDFR